MLRSPPPISRRAGTKQAAVLDRLRKEIIGGTFPAGSRMPTREELQERFGVSWFTVQQAFDRLTEDGFVRARGRLGTQVSERPPHLCHYGLVFPCSSSADRRSWSKFWVTLEHVARGIWHGDDRQVSTLFGGDGRLDSSDYRQLLATIRAHRVAGLIFCNNPLEMENTPVLTEPGIPRVIMGQYPHAEGETRYVAADQEAFLGRALDYLHARGRRNVAMFYFPNVKAYMPSHLEDLQRGCAARGMVTRPYWNQPAVFPSGEIIRHPAMLLGRLPPSDRPDAVIIRDDNLVEPVLAGLIEAGVRIPQDIEVVAHTNFPCPPTILAPVKRLGFDCRELLTKSAEVIDQLRRREKPPQMTLVPPAFEDELSRN